MSPSKAPGIVLGEAPLVRLSCIIREGGRYEVGLDIGVLVGARPRDLRSPYRIKSLSLAQLNILPLMPPAQEWRMTVD
jgi:hypothetical protein